MYNQKLKLKSILALILMICFFSCCSTLQKSGAEKISKTGFAFNTVIDITIYNGGSAAVIDGCFLLCSELEKIFSTTLEESELYQINKNNSLEQNKGKTYKISDELAYVMKKGLEYCAAADGSFDITIRPVTELWVFDGTNDIPPETELLKERLKLVDYRNIVLEGNELSFKTPGMAVELGSIAKGYIADRLKEYLLDNGVDSAVIDLGGNILCVGKRPDGACFNIGVQTTFSDNEQLSFLIKAEDLSIVTSGIYERCFEYDGRFYHHILDASTGYPLDNDLSAVTVLSEKSVDGDALSTVLFSSGEEKGLQIVNNIANIYAIFVHKDGRKVYSENFPMDLVLENQ